MIELVALSYITLAPVIVAGILNMIVVRLPLLRPLYTPIDGGYILADGKRLFGDNKTWLGAVSMVVLTTVSAVVLYGSVGYGFFNSSQNSVLLGVLLGLAYIVSELPNSFVKRRIGIAPGGFAQRKYRMLHIAIDHLDSVIGCGFVALWLGSVSWVSFIAMVCVGGVTHLLLAQLLVSMGIKKSL